MSEERLPRSERPSRSQRKREAEEITALAGKLSNFPPRKLKLLTLDEDVLELISDLKKMRRDAARKRYVKTLGKMLGPDEVQAIKALL